MSCAVLEAKCCYQNEEGLEEKQERGEKSADKRDKDQTVCGKQEEESSGCGGNKIGSEKTEMQL